MTKCGKHARCAAPARPSAHTHSHTDTCSTGDRNVPGGQLSFEFGTEFDAHGSSHGRIQVRPLPPSPPRLTPRMQVAHIGFENPRWIEGRLEVVSPSQLVFQWCVRPPAPCTHPPHPGTPCAGASTAPKSSHQGLTCSPTRRCHAGRMSCLWSRGGPRHKGRMYCRTVHETKRHRHPQTHSRTPSSEAHRSLAQLRARLSLSAFSRRFTRTALTPEVGRPRHRSSFRSSFTVRSRVSAQWGSAKSQTPARPPPAPRSPPRSVPPSASAAPPSQSPCARGRGWTR